MSRKVYFGHPVNVYNTELERSLLWVIRDNFPDWEIENPNQKKHDEGYARYKKETGNGMEYYFQEVLPHCQVGVFLPFRDFKYGAGVFKEAEFLAKRNYPIWEITEDFLLVRVPLKNMSVLSIEETRARVRNPDGSLIPY